MDISSKKKINKETLALNYKLDEMDLIDMYGTFHLKETEYIFFSSGYGTLSRIQHMLLLFSCLVMSDSLWPHRRQPTRLPRPWDSPGKNTGVGCHFLLQCMKMKSESEVAQSCPTLSDPMDCSLPGSSLHGIFQARALEWGAIAFSIYTLLCIK